MDKPRFSNDPPGQRRRHVGFAVAMLAHKLRPIIDAHLTAPSAKYSEGGFEALDALAILAAERCVWGFSDDEGRRYFWRRLRARLDDELRTWNAADRSAPPAGEA